MNKKYCTTTPEKPDGSEIDAEAEVAMIIEIALRKMTVKQLRDLVNKILDGASHG